VRVHHDVDATDILALLEKVRDEATPDERFWSGVRELRLEEHQVVVELHDRVDPGLLRAGQAEVACHLYDPRLAPLAAT
jgi:peptide/nickel transport system ATP-binding protein